MRKVIEGQNQFCGPAVLSILTGKSTDECASILAHICGQVEVREVSLENLKKALKKLRFNIEQVIKEEQSLYSTMIQISRTDGMYVVVVKKHVVAIEVENKKVWFCDNHTKEPINGASSARLGQLVLAAYRVSEKEPAILINDKIECKIQKYSNSVYLSVAQHCEYKDSEDNYSRSLGMLQVKDEAELKRVRDEILKVV